MEGTGAEVCGWASSYLRAYPNWNLTAPLLGFKATRSLEGSGTKS